MDPICYKVPRQKEETVIAEYWDLPYFYRPIHFHEDCQLTLILEGEGILFLGDKLDTFRKGQIFLIGKNVPHVFHHEEDWYNKQSSNHARAISVFFSQDTFENIFKEVPESYKLINLLNNLSKGVRLGNGLAKQIEPDMKSLLKLTGLRKVFELMEILRQISISNNIQLISTNTKMVVDEEDSEKLDKIFEYIITRHMEQISLDEVASLVCMTPTSFCRYFKSRTQKTFSAFLTEVRISNACKYLGQKGYNVAEACYASGYNNISNFHRHFQNIMGLTPNQYKRQRIKSKEIQNTETLLIR